MTDPTRTPHVTRAIPLGGDLTETDRKRIIVRSGIGRRPRLPVSGEPRPLTLYERRRDERKKAA